MIIACEQGKEWRGTTELEPATSDVTGARNELCLKCVSFKSNNFRSHGPTSNALEQPVLRQKEHSY